MTTATIVTQGLPQERDHAPGWLATLARRVVPRRSTTVPNPSVEQIADQIMALECGASCDVRLNPRRMRINNLKWLLPICVGQFGTEIAIADRMDGTDVVLTITATATRPWRRARAAPETGQLLATLLNAA